VKIKIWGCRGSIPAPSTAEFVTNRYGGNTTCVSISVPGQVLILDAGTGLRNLGLALAEQPGLRATFFFSHVHWDHIQGFPFFLPSFDRDSVFNLYGRSHPQLPNFGGSAVANALLLQQQSLNFPVALDQMGAQMHFFNLVAGQCVELPGNAGVLAVTAGELNHPGSCFGYRIEYRSGGKARSFVFATDTEHGDKVNANLQTLARGADILLYDAQFTPEEYPSYVGWGHSTWVHGLRECAAAGVKRLLLTHHDPLRDDWALARIETDARQEGRKLGIEVDAAREGMEIEL
jgi:phosphoribosyl 1,2-cyclic phosphodiesterase